MVGEKIDFREPILSPIKIILKNIFSLSVSELLSRIINFFTVVYLARIILPEGFGALNFSIVFVSYFSIALNFGLDQYSVREIAKDQSAISRFVNSIITTRLIFFIVLYLLLAIIAFGIIENRNISWLLLITGVNLFSAAISVCWVYQAKERMHVNGLKQTLASMLNLAGVLIFVHSKNDIIVAAVIASSALLLNALIFLKIFIKDFFPICISIDKKFISQLLKGAAPFAFASFAVAIYHHIDIVMLGIIHNQYIVGIYSSAYKMVYMALVPLSIITSAFFPQVVKKDLESIKRNQRIRKLYIFMMVVSGLVFSMVLFVCADKILMFVFGDAYLNGINSLMILALNVLVIAFNMIISTLLVAWGHEKKYSYIIFTGALVNILLNILFIPKYYSQGAALATLITEVIVFLLSVFSIYMILSDNKTRVA